MIRENSDDAVTLETMIDRHDLQSVIDALMHICIGKELHIKETWQDKALAREWRKATDVLAKVSDKISV